MNCALREIPDTVRLDCCDQADQLRNSIFTCMAEVHGAAV
jgi:hypothetical protein